MLSRAIPAPCPCSASVPALLPVQLCPAPSPAVPSPSPAGSSFVVPMLALLPGIEGDPQGQSLLLVGEKSLQTSWGLVRAAEASPWDAFIVLVLRQSEFGNIHQLDVPEEPEHDPGWWQMACGPAGRCLLLPSRGKVRARGACASISPRTGANECH